MIIDLKKYLFIGAREELDAFFEKAQEKGLVEFISPSGKKPIEMPDEAQNLITAMKILRKQPVKSPYTGPFERALADEVAQRVINLKTDIEKHLEDKRLLEAEISRVAPFGDFSMEDIDYIEKQGHRKIQFFCMKTSKSHKVHFTDEVIYISTEYDLDYFITVNPEYRAYPEMIEMRIDRSVGELQSQLDFVKDSLHQMEAELKGFAGHIEFLHETLLEELDLYHLNQAKKEATYPLDTTLFAVEAWVPKNKTDQLFPLIDARAVHCEEISIEKEDRVPTCMENKGMNQAGQDLVLFYDVPAITDKDPSCWVLAAFAFFFAIIVADGGYGLIFLALAVYLKYKFPDLKGQMKRMLKLFVLLAASCVVWGVLTSSYFGIKLGPSNFLSKISPLHYLAEKKAEYHFRMHDGVYQYWVKEYPGIEKIQGGRNILQKAAHVRGDKVAFEMLNDFSNNILLEFSLFVGIVHIALSMLRFARRNWAGIGWIIFMFGGFLYFPKMLHATSVVHFMGWISKDTAYAVGMQLMICGLGLAAILAILQKKAKGLTEISHILSIFANVLSYTRLYALALAATIMAETFNDIGVSMPLVAGIFVILAGHLITINLGTMSGVIHGLRLNFLEWYHFSFEGGGKLFNPLRRLKTQD